MVSEVNVAVPAGPGVEAGMVVLGEVGEPYRRLRIVIAQTEARAIQAAWTGVVPARPSTWDLFVSAIASLEGRLDRAVIASVVEDRHFFANLELERDGERRTLVCRPSDAVAVALRAYGMEMYATTEVMDTAGLAEDGTKYGPYVKPEAPPGPAASPEETLTEEAGVAEETPRVRGARRTRSGREPRKAASTRRAVDGASPPKARPVSAAKKTPAAKRTPATKKTSTAEEATGAPAQNTAAESPVREGTPPAP